MLTFFIAIVLIAEIVITFHIISFILKIDKKICELNEEIVALTPTIEDTLTSARISINKILLTLNKFEQKLQSKTEEFKFNILKSVITTVLYLLLNTSGKKVLSIIELAFSLKDVMDKWTEKLA